MTWLLNLIKDQPAMTFPCLLSVLICSFYFFSELFVEACLPFLVCAFEIPYVIIVLHVSFPLTFWSVFRTLFISAVIIVIFFFSS